MADDRGGDAPPAATPPSPRSQDAQMAPATPPPPAARAPPRTPPSPLSPMSPVSASVRSVSASAVSATDMPYRYGGFPEVSASVDATPMPRYLGQAAGQQDEDEDDVEAELRRLAQRQLPRGDLGRREWRLDAFTPAAAAASAASAAMADASAGAPEPPRSPSSSSAASIRSAYGGDAPGPSRAALPRPPASPPSSPRSASRASASASRDSPRSGSRSFSTFPATAGGSQEGLAGAVVWGTNISVQESMGLFRSFLREFRPPGGPPEAEPHYVAALRRLELTQSLVLDLDTQHLLQARAPATRKVYNQLVLFPQVLIRLLDMVAFEEFLRLFPGAREEDARVQVRPFNLSDLSPMRQLNPADIDQLVCLKGMVTRCSGVIPDLKEAFFRCSLCRAEATVELDRGRIEEPAFCARCNARWCMEMVHNRCAFTDKQLVKMQETPDAIPEGETPHTVMLFAFDDLVDDVRPGDKVEVTGIYRAVPMRASSRQRVVKSVFKTYIDVVHFRRVDELSRRAAEPADADAAMEDVDAAMEDAEDAGDAGSEAARVEEFRRIAAHPSVYENLAHSLAPSIWELDDVKKGILCMLFGGTRKDEAGNVAAGGGGEEDALAGGGGGGAGRPRRTTRADMNVLLCGDPGTSKSQLLSYVHKLSPRSIYTSGKGSSAVGLTASIVRDGETGELVLESGALVLSDEGVCCIDEFDKMSDSARSVLHEAMEQQTVSIAKAGIICSLNARASILASANPIESRYNPAKSVVENVNILPTLLSRFDLIYLILDKPQPETDRRLARHIVALYYGEDARRRRRQRGHGPQLIRMKLLTEYIAFAKRTVHPRLSPAARDALVAAYLDLRRMGGGGGAVARRTITATPRQLESLIRIAEALARMRLAALVERRDVHEALRLMNVATQRAAMDPRTGTIDMDMINTGHSSLEREAVADAARRLRALLAEAPGHSLAVAEARRRLEDAAGRPAEAADERRGRAAEFQTALRALEDDGAVQVSHGVVRYVGDPLDAAA